MQVKIHARAIISVPIADLKPYERNARKHPPEQIATLAAVIKDSGFTTPVLIDGKNLIIAGHGRLLAAQKLGMAAVPCVRVEGLSPTQILALRLSDNAIGLRSTWDEDMLRLELADLTALGADLDLTGFNTTELADLMGGGGGLTDPDEVPETPKDPVVKAGDFWHLGPHRLLVGDSTDQAAVGKLLAGAAPLLMVTDPPYGIGYEYRTHDDKDAAANAQLVADVFAYAPKGKVWTPGLMNLRRDFDRFGEAKQVFWHKGFAAAGNGLGGASTIEPVLVVTPPVKKLPDDYLHFPTDRSKVGGVDLRKLHSCPKPVALFAHLVRAFSARSHAIYEPFAGSGTTLIACEMEKRVCYGMEIDPAYGQVIIERWEAFTGKKALLDGKLPISAILRTRNRKAK